MSDEIKRPGYLRFKCDCGALIKVDCDDPASEIHKASAVSSITHECDPDRLGIAKLIGCTFSDEATKYCSTNAE